MNADPVYPFEGSIRVDPGLPDHAAIAQQHDPPECGQRTVACHQRIVANLLCGLIALAAIFASTMSRSGEGCE